MRRVSARTRVTGNANKRGWDTAGSNGADGKRVTIVTADGKTLVAGDSAYTVTGTDYAASADFSGAGSVAAWSTYAAEKPTHLTTGTLSDGTV